jgi:hypothetical protein
MHLRVTFVICLCSAVCVRESSPAPACARFENELWAGISVSRPLLDLNAYTVDPFMLRFGIVNETGKTVNPEIKSAKLLVNGKEMDITPKGALIELSDDRWDALPTGDYLSFSVDVSKYFDKAGTYRVVWKGKSFQSQEILFRVVGSKKK